jgi:alpha-methylacyl-CoA racemase
LTGIKGVEVAGLGAAPFGGMILSDLGAEIIRVDRIPGTPANDPGAVKDSFVDRGRRSISLNLKSQVGREVLLKLVERADVLIEAFRPGVAERLGFGPDACLLRNPRLVYSRMTGWGQME